MENQDHHHKKQKWGSFSNILSFVVFSCFFVIGISNPVSAASSSREAHMTILAVGETDNGTLVGSPADLYLEIQPGKGRVFLDTFPFQRIDTQFSTRFAKDIACTFIGDDCNSYDFIYTIRANSSLVSGPSASGAIAVITVALLENLDIDESVSMTGTINGGGIIGIVGDVKEKIDAAKMRHIRKVIVPYGSNATQEGNRSIDLFTYAKENGIELVEVSTLKEAIYHFTGKQYASLSGNITPDRSYTETMKQISSELCSRGDEILSDVPKANFSGTDALNLTRKAKEAYAQGRYYSAASYCYGANTIYRYEDFKNLPLLSAYGEMNAIQDRIDSMKNLSFDTIANLQTSMVVNERLREAESYLDVARRYINNTDIRNTNIAGAKERLYSAEVWSTFSDDHSENYTVDSSSLMESCYNTYAEAEEQFNYLGLINRGLTIGAQPDIEDARRYQDEGNYVLCLFMSEKTKAKMNMLYESFSFDEQHLPIIIEQKRKLVEELILEQQQKGLFPILGYSYYEYAESLKEEDPYSALLYLEYALEFSDLNIYLKETKAKPLLSKELPKEAITLAEGILIGMIVLYLILFSLRLLKE